MSQNTLIEKINNDAAKTVEEIKAQGATEVQNIQSAIEAELEHLNQDHKTNLDKKKAQMELVAVSKAKQSGNIAVQTAKRQQIDTIFTAVASELAAQSSEDYVKFFAKYVSEIVPKDAEIVSVQAPKNRAEETAEVLKRAGLSGEVKSDDALNAGLVINAKDGVYDITLNRLMNEKRADLEMLVVNKVEA